MKKQVLLIDDNQSISTLIASLLREEYDVTVKHNGLDAMLWLGQGHLPDVILADVAMPRLSGVEFINNLKASGFFCDVPVLVLTDEDKTEMTIQCMNAGATDYIFKPFTPSELLDKVSKTTNYSEIYAYGN
jgi:DNA-binding response OmpR family regulator